MELPEQLNKLFHCSSSSVAFVHMVGDTMRTKGIPVTVRVWDGIGGANHNASIWGERGGLEVRHLQVHLLWVFVRHYEVGFIEAIIAPIWGSSFVAVLVKYARKFSFAPRGTLPESDKSVPVVPVSPEVHAQ